MTEPSPLLQVDRLAVDIDVDGVLVHAVRDVSFTLRRGQTLALVGESGSGKSVTAQAIMAILPGRARVTSGSIQLAPAPNSSPINLVSEDPDGPLVRGLRGRAMSMVFQEPMTSLSPLHRVGAQVAEMLTLHERLSKREARTRVEAMFERVGFHEPGKVFQSYPFQLSGGMRQRVMIAMALVCRPPLLIADEPTTALDVTTQAQILDLIGDLQRESRMGLLLITHDLGIVANLADEVVVMHRGEVMERGSRVNIFRNAKHPYLRGLLRAVPQIGRGERLASPGQEESGAPPPTAPSELPDIPVLSIDRVSKTFTLRSGWPVPREQRISALVDVSLTVRRGRTLGVVGESGSGKTTLLRVITRSIAPDTGSVRFDAGDGPCDVAALDGAALKRFRRTVQMVFQDPFSSLNPRLTVFESLTEPLVVHAVGNRASRSARARELVEVVGLEESALRRYPHSFSGGQRQRLAIARALMLEPSVVLCDEPTSALDVSVQAQILNLLRDLQARLGVAYLFISHNLAVVDYLADEIAVMCRGRVVEIAPTRSLFASPRHPYTQALLAALPVPDLDHPLDFGAVSGSFSDPAAWPEPFRIIPLGAEPPMVEVEPGHRVRQWAPVVTAGREVVDA